MASASRGISFPRSHGFSNPAAAFTRILFTRILGVTLLSVAALAARASAQAAVGAGGYATDGNFAQPAAKPSVTADFAQHPKSGQWWATLMTQTYSDNLFPHPASYKAKAAGLEMGYPGAPSYADNGGFASQHNADLTIGIEGMNAPAAQIASYSDWAVTARWIDGAKTMEATFGHGMPFAYFKIAGGKAAIACSGKPWYDQDGTLGVTVAGHSYAIFAPTGSTWSGTGTVTSALNGKDYLSVALLPDGSPETLAFFRKYAFSFVRNTKVTWFYRDADAHLVSTYSVLTDVKEGTENGTLLALFRHQWLDVSTPLTQYSYQSARGEMKVSAGTSFITSMQFNGLLPALPMVGQDPASVKNSISGFSGDVGGGDSYSSGKSMGRIAEMATIANLAGDTAKRNDLVKRLETGLEGWFTAGGNQQLWYNPTWNTLVGYPASFYTDTRLTDHHFHYGYFIMAAAVIAQFDPAWAAHDKWGGMVEMLIREVNSWDDADPLFARYKYFDPYEGHGWADGMGFDRGNNQESSSESMNCNAGIIQWGINTGNKTIRDLGLFMYVNEARAVEQYWFDVDGQVFPKNYGHNAVGIVWSNGGAYSTWFSADVGQIHGINILPMAAGSLYLGRRPDHIVKNYAEGDKGTWTDLFLQYLALADGDQAASKYGAGVDAEAGDSKPHAAYAIKSLQAAGRLNTAIAASIPSFAVFDKSAPGASAATRTYTAFNPSDATVSVSFTDGFKMDVPAHAQLTKQGPAQTIAVLARPRAASRAAPWLWNGVGQPARYPLEPVFDMQGRSLPARGRAAGAADPGMAAPGRFQGLYIIRPLSP